MNEAISIPDEIKLVLGGIPISLQAAHPGFHLILEPALHPFFSSSTPDVVLQIHNGPSPFQDLGEAIFDSGGNWSLYRWEDRDVFRARANGANPDRPYYIAAIDSDRRRGDIYFEKVSGEDHPNVIPALAPPLDEILVVHLLGQSRGLMVHAGAVSLNGHGLLFTGTSGSGKSTQLKLWKTVPDARLLGDERISIRKDEDHFWIHGTHWRSSAGIASPDAAPLKAIFILNHAISNHATLIQPSVSVPSILVRSFPPFWDAEGMSFTLKFLDELVNSIPCYELSLVPDSSAVDYVRWMLSL